MEAHALQRMMATRQSCTNNSDLDLRGVHLLPLKTVRSLEDGQQTVEKEEIYDGLEIDLVTHHAAKFCGLMLKRNGYVLRSLPTHPVLRGVAKLITSFAPQLSGLEVA